MSKQGKTVLYSEDGGRYECLVLTDTSGPGKDQYKLRVIQVFNQDRYGHEVEPGDEFDVMQRTDMGAWAGMWHVEDIIGSSKTSLHKEIQR